MHTLWKLKCLNNTLALHLKELSGSRITLPVMAVQADGPRLWADRSEPAREGKAYRSLSWA
jgi:hypothetical protein